MMMIIIIIILHECCIALWICPPALEHWTENIITSFVCKSSPEESMCEPWRYYKKEKKWNKTKDVVYLKLRCGQYFYFFGAVFVTEYSGVIFRGLSSKGGVGSFTVFCGNLHWFLFYYYFGLLSILDCPWRSVMRRNKHQKGERFGKSHNNHTFVSLLIVLSWWTFFLLLSMLQQVICPLRQQPCIVWLFLNLRTGDVIIIDPLND